MTVRCQPAFTPLNETLSAPYKYPREVEFVTELPKAISGKIRRVELRERERARKAQQAGG